jgi:hypothetical protein
MAAINRHTLDTETYIVNSKQYLRTRITEKTHLRNSSSVILIDRLQLSARNWSFGNRTWPQDRMSLYENVPLQLLVLRVVV